MCTTTVLVLINYYPNLLNKQSSNNLTFISNLLNQKSRNDFNLLHFTFTFFSTS